MSEGERLERFTAFSAAVTGFTAFDVRGTGLAESYLSTVTEILGDELVDELLAAWDRSEAAAQGDAAKLENVLRREIFSDEKLGPIARNMVKLWYVGIWYELPPRVDGLVRGARAQRHVHGLGGRLHRGPAVAGDRRQSSGREGARLRLVGRSATDRRRTDAVTRISTTGRRRKLREEGFDDE